MRARIIYLTVVALAGITVSLSSCVKDQLENFSELEGTEALSGYEGFDFSTVKQHAVTITFLDNKNLPLEAVYCEIYLNNPLDEVGHLIKGSQEFRIYKGLSDKTGRMSFEIKPPSHVSRIYILTYHTGIQPLHEATLERGGTNIVIGGETIVFKSGQSRKLKDLNDSPAVVNGYYTLGGWNSYGVPDYLEPVNDHLSSDFLLDVNASLPEYERLPQSHPQYLASNDDVNLVILDNCEVWITFVHEGAGWHNTLGYYTYPTGSEPQQVNDITNRTIIFPDVSNYSNGLSPGNKVQLKYLDPVTNQYSTTFPEGTTIGWFLVAKGWSNQTVSTGVYTHYSDVGLNNESDPELKKHNVLLYDEARELLLLGFEDIRRDNSGCDEDFNDAIFYASTNPITAVDRSIYQPVDQPTDSDNDGVTDVFDAYPNDPTRSFASYYPAEDQFGTLVYEDLWPGKGDYDFNDLVLEYNFNQITNSQSQLIAIRAQIIVKAIGASYHNAFGISFNTSPSNVQSVSGQRITKGYLDINSNGTENGQSKAVVIFFDDAYNVLSFPGTGHFVNTDPASPTVTPDTINVEIDFVKPLSFASIGTPPYNPFIIINRKRGVEIHLPNMPPTDLVDQSLFGTQADDSDPSIEKYYVSDVYLPWSINLPVSFDYPIEKESITAGHLRFNDWARSNGFSYMDWYENRTNYRIHSLIY